MSELKFQCWICPICYDDHRYAVVDGSNCEKSDLVSEIKKLRAENETVKEQFAAREEYHRQDYSTLLTAYDVVVARYEGLKNKGYVPLYVTETPEVIQLRAANAELYEALVEAQTTICWEYHCHSRDADYVCPGISMFDHLKPGDKK